MKGCIRQDNLFFRLLGLVLFLPLASWLLHSCATPTAPLGGPRDETPPQIVEEESTPNFQTNFEKQTIELTFDEWVILEKIRDEVVISPPLPADPEIKLKKRTVQLIFQDTIQLRENATYTINFGEAVKDLNEKNPADDLRFVFSTGPAIDSLSISGRIVDITNGEPVEKCLFMLYENLADTVVRTERPFYFGKTDENGQFTIENIREGTYKGFALEDTGIKKYLFESNERLAFPPDLIIIQTDTTQNPQNLELKIFAEKIPLVKTDTDTSRFGKVKFVFNQPIYDLNLSYNGILDTPLVQFKEDSLLLWYDQEQAWTLFLQQDTSFFDTIKIGANGRSTLIDQANFRAVGLKANENITPGVRPSVGYNHPLSSFDTSLISLYVVDSVRTKVQANFEIDSLNPQRLVFDHPWTEELTYELEILPGGLTDMFGINTKDSLLTKLTLTPIKRFGNILLNLSNLDSASNYLVQLVSKDLKRILLSDPVSGLTTYETQWTTIPAGDYMLRVITDNNNNGRWDTGNYDQNLQPEPIYLRALDKLRSNWDLDASIRYGEVVVEPEKTVEEQPQSRTGRGRGRN